MGGGGDGGAQAEADRVRVEESKRERQLAVDKAKINALFGIEDYDYTKIPDVLPSGSSLSVSRPLTQANRDSAESQVDFLTKYLSGDTGAEVPEGMALFKRRRGLFGSKSSPGYDTWQDDPARALADAERYLETFKANIPGYDYDPLALEAQAASSAATREETLSGIYDDILGKYNYEQDQQYGRKSADIKSMLAGRGLSRSSVGQSVFDRLNEIRDTNTVDFEEGASSAIDRIRAGDTETRGELVSKLDAGGDYGNARATALAKLTQNVNAGMNEANARDLSNLFKGMDELYGQKQYVDAYNTGQRYGSSNITTPGSSSSSGSGTILTV